MKTFRISDLQEIKLVEESIAELNNKVVDRSFFTDYNGNDFIDFSHTFLFHFFQEHHPVRFKKKQTIKNRLVNTIGLLKTWAGSKTADDVQRLSWKNDSMQITRMWPVLDPEEEATTALRNSLRTDGQHPIYPSHVQAGSAEVLMTRQALANQDFLFELYSEDLKASSAFFETIREQLTNLSSRIKKQLKYLLKGQKPLQYIDWRAGFRRIVNHIFKNLDDEHSSVNNYRILSSIYLTQNYNEKTIHHRCYQ